MKVLGLGKKAKPCNLRTTIISPGAVDTELPNTISEPDVAKGFQEVKKNYAAPADSTKFYTGRQSRNFNH
jgi:NADP-dependent 3-hydroxy acid dehydrogenase YdfG